MTWVEVALCHRKRIHIRINLPSDHLNWGCFQGQRPMVYISFKLSHDGDGHQMHSSAMVVCRLISGSLLPDVCKVGLNASVLYQIRPRFFKKITQSNISRLKITFDSQKVWRNVLLKLPIALEISPQWPHYLEKSKNVCHFWQHLQMDMLSEHEIGFIIFNNEKLFTMASIFWIYKIIYLTKAVTSKKR